MNKQSWFLDHISNTQYSEDIVDRIVSINTYQIVIFIYQINRILLLIIFYQIIIKNIHIGHKEHYNILCSIKEYEYDKMYKQIHLTLEYYN